MNWKDLEFVDFKINPKTGKKYYQQYLKPSYYLEIYFRWTYIEEVSQFYDYVLDKLGSLFTYHHSNKKSRESKFKDPKQAFAYFSDFLNSNQDYCWFQLSNAGGVGNNKEIGGVSDASFKTWFHKAFQNDTEKLNRLNKYKNLLSEYDTDMLPNGIRISNITVSFPIDSFKNPYDFRDWVLNAKLLKEGTFFSGSAGYKINSWQGYVNKDAQKKLNQILIDYPGLDSDISIGNSMGRVLTEDKSDIIPVIKRLNWLNFISDKGIELLGDFKKIKAEIEENDLSTIHDLSKGVCIQTTELPSILKESKEFNQYFKINNIINKLCYKSHPMDSYSLTGRKGNSIVKDWLYFFNQK